MPTPDPLAPQNRLLQALPPRELDVLRPRLHAGHLPLKQRLYEAGCSPEAVYFPHDAVASLVTELDGTLIELATVGWEGMVGVPVFLGLPFSSVRALIQVSGEGSWIEADAFRGAIRRTPKLRQLLSVYTGALLNQIAQNIACQRVHGVEQRLARWLLMTHDSVHRDRFVLTQEFMAQMLGTSRPTMSLAASALQRSGLISYVRGSLTISDRAGLEAATCQCYRAIRIGLDRVFEGESKEQLHQGHGRAVGPMTASECLGA
jgi:CRP-like cAMP-binding protein